MVVVMVINPRPPTCINSIMTTLPKRVQWVPVSTTASPVTQTAEVAVKSALTKPTLAPSTDEIGRLSSNAPMKITAANPKTNTCAGCNTFFGPELNSMFATPLA